MTPLDIRDLSLRYATDRGPAHVLRGVSLQARRGGSLLQAMLTHQRIT